MTLLPNVPFAEGDNWTPALAYLALQRPTFDDQPQYLNHGARIADDELSNQAGAIKQRLSSYSDAFAVTAGTGLAINVAAGTLRLVSLETVNKTPSVIVCPDNTTSFVYFDQLGVLNTALYIPPLSCLLAKVVTASGSVFSIQDMRSLALRNITARPQLIKLHGGNSVTDYTAVQNDKLEGLVFCRHFYVPSGVSITVNKYCKIFCETFTADGTISITPATQGGGGYYGSLGVQYLQMASGLGVGASNGHNRPPSDPYNFFLQPYGSGGNPGLIYSSAANTSVSQGDAGDGGGGIWVEASGDIKVNGIITAIGGNATNPVINAGSAAMSGNSAGSGGTVVLISLSKVRAASSSSMSVKSGNGGNSISNIGGVVPTRGKAGGGGQVVIFSPVIELLGTIDLTTGTDGTATTSPTLGGACSGSNGGRGGIGGTNALIGRLVTAYESPIGV